MEVNSEQSLGFYSDAIINNYERASAASGASSFVFKGKIWVFAARPGPTRPDPITLFKALISQEPHVWSTSGLLCWIPHGCKSCMALLPYCVSAGHGTWARAKLGVLWTTPKTLYLNNRTTAGPIWLRLGIQLGTQQTIHVCGSFLGCFSTCARAHPASISRERLNRLRWNLACS